MLHNTGKKVVLISGASRGVGETVAGHLGGLGYIVGVGYKSNRAKALEVVESIRQNDGKAIDIHFDYLRRSTIESAVKDIGEYADAPVSILINNGAIAQEKPFDTITDEDWERMLQVNLQGPFAASQEVLANMREQKWGRIINVSSIGGQWGGFNQVHYAAAKAALINLTQSLAKIYSTEGVISVAIAIGLVQTKMSESELSTPAGRQKVAAIPAGRLATKREIATTIAFLCRDEAAYLTGQTLNLNGGMYFN